MRKWHKQILYEPALRTSIELRLGKALDTLPLVAADGRGPFDMIFIDADKPNIPAYFGWALKLSRVGCLIIVDNVVRDGAVIDCGKHGYQRAGRAEIQRIAGR